MKVKVYMMMVVEEKIEALVVLVEIGRTKSTAMKNV